MIKTILISSLIASLLPIFYFAKKRHDSFKELAKLIKDEIYIRSILSNEYWLSTFSFISTILFYGLFFIKD